MKSVLYLKHDFTHYGNLNFKKNVLVCIEYQEERPTVETPFSSSESSKHST